MKQLILGVFIVVLFISCKSKSKFDVDVSNIKVDISFNRLDKDLFSAGYDSITKTVKYIRDKYGKFFELYSNKIINIGDINNKDYPEKLKDFIYYCKSNGVVSKVEEIFPQTDSIKSELIKAFQYYKYYFPKFNIPAVFTYISAFHESIITDEGILGIGLDKYLGANTDFYAQLGWEKYVRQKMHKLMIPVDCMRAMAMMQFPKSDSLNTLISEMVYEGKIQYFLDATLPNTHDSLKWGYTSRQVNWAEKYENKVWAYLVEKKQLFITETTEIRKYVGQAPFTVMFANVSAPRMGTWVGYKIVKAYMERNPDVTLYQLMMDQDVQKILNKSKYNP